MNDLDTLKSNPLILHLYSQRVHLQGNNSKYTGKCPFHTDAVNSFAVYPDKDGILLWKCFAECAQSGNIFQFLEKFDHITFNEAVKKVRDYVGQSFEAKKEEVEKVFKPVGAEQPKKTYTMEEYAVYDLNTKPNEDAFKWLESRGINKETALKMHVGFRQNVGKLTPEVDIANKGWIVFPCIENGLVVSIKYRSIIRKAFARQPGMKTALFGVE